MDHLCYFDGNKKMISWVIQDGEAKFEQTRNHVENYLDKISIEQSKYIALHVGIFWAIGRFIIKNGDIVKIMLDLKSMYEYLTGKKQSHDGFIESRINFIKQIIEQRDLQVQFEIIEPSQNIAAKLLSS
jgi:N-acetylmuramoyl-L-alanine amidase CwlA